MRREDDFGTMTHQVLDGLDGCSNSGVIGDVEVLIQRYVPITLKNTFFPFRSPTLLFVANMIRIKHRLHK